MEIKFFIKITEKGNEISIVAQNINLKVKLQFNFFLFIFFWFVCLIHKDHKEDVGQLNLQVTHSFLQIARPIIHKLTSNL